MVAMAEAGASCFGQGLAELPSTRFLIQALKYAGLCGKRVHLFPLEADWSGTPGIATGPVADLNGIGGTPPLAETIAVFRILQVARSCGAPVHLKHLTLPASVELVAHAREQSVDVTCDVALQSLLHSHDELDTLDPMLLLRPPLRSALVRTQLVECVLTGQVDAISAQHIPVLPEHKNEHFTAAQPGALGLETALPLLLEMLPGDLTARLARALELLSSQPHRILDAIETDRPLELFLFDADKEWVVSPDDFAGPVSNTPEMGRKLKGRCRGMLLRGEWACSPGGA
jgi:dihydroorotase